MPAVRYADTRGSVFGVDQSPCDAGGKPGDGGVFGGESGYGTPGPSMPE